MKVAADKKLSLSLCSSSTSSPWQEHKHLFTHLVGLKSAAPLCVSCGGGKRFSCCTCVKRWVPWAAARVSPWTPCAAEGQLGLLELLRTLGRCLPWALASLRSAPWWPNRSGWPPKRGVRRCLSYAWWLPQSPPLWGACSDTNQTAGSSCFRRLGCPMSI